MEKPLFIWAEMIRTKTAFAMDLRRWSKWNLMNKEIPRKTRLKKENQNSHLSQMEIQLMKQKLVNPTLNNRIQLMNSRVVLLKMNNRMELLKVKMNSRVVLRVWIKRDWVIQNMWRKRNRTGSWRIEGDDRLYKVMIIMMLIKWVIMVMVV